MVLAREVSKARRRVDELGLEVDEVDVGEEAEAERLPEPGLEGLLQLVDVLLDPGPAPAEMREI